jgi:hypothetical protein
MTTPIPPCFEIASHPASTLALIFSFTWHLPGRDLKEFLITSQRHRCKRRLIVHQEMSPWMTLFQWCHARQSKKMIFAHTSANKLPKRRKRQSLPAFRKSASGGNVQWFRSSSRRALARLHRIRAWCVSSTSRPQMEQTRLIVLILRCRPSRTPRESVTARHANTHIFWGTEAFHINSQILRSPFGSELVWTEENSCQDSCIPIR